MSATTTISLKINQQTKASLVKKAHKNNQNMSEYIRNLLMENLGTNDLNPFLKLANTMTSSEADNMIKTINESKKSHPNSKWSKLIN